MGPQPKPPLNRHTSSAPAAVPAYDVHEIVKGGDRAQLILDGQTYLLRITRAGKLILTK